MSWADVAGPAASDIHAEFADATIDIMPASSEAIVGVSAIEVYYDGDLPFSEGGTVFRHGFEVQKANVPTKPRNGTIIVHGEAQYRIVEPRDGRDVAAWLLMVEEV